MARREGGRELLSNKPPTLRFEEEYDPDEYQ
jgi:hypothetical protein